MTELIKIYDKAGESVSDIYSLGSVWRELTILI